MAGYWRSGLLQSWDRLIAAHPSITGEEDRNGARLFAAIIIVHISAVIFFINLIALAYLHYAHRSIWSDRDGLVVMAGVFVIAFAFILLKRGWYRTAVGLYVAISAVVPLASPFVDDPNAEIGLLATGIITPLLASFVYPVRRVNAIILAMALVASWRLLHSGLPPRTIGTGFTILISILVCGLLIVAFRLRFRALEKSRIEKLNESEQALRRTTERLRVLLGNSMDILIGIDRHFIISFIGGAFEESTGFLVQDKLGKPVFELIVAEDCPLVREALESLASRLGQSKRMEWRQLNRNGSIQWYEALLTNRLGQPGLDNIIINLRDITERLEAAKSMQRSEAKYHDLFETVSDGIFITDDQGRILEVNKGACNLLGYSSAELRGKNLEEITPYPDSVARLREEILAGKMGPHEVENIRKDGTIIPVDLSVSTIVYEGRYAFMGLARDISERKRAQAEKKKLETQVEQAARMETIGRLAGGVAHDFNNLLTVILGHTEVIEGELGVNSPHLAGIGVVRGAAKSASLLVQHLLAFSRKETLSPRLLDLNTQITSILRISGGLIGEKVEVDFRPEPGPAIIRVDPTVIERIILNLAINARDAMPEGGKLEISSKPVVIGPADAREFQDTAPGRYILLTVSDTGTGMTEEVKGHIFEPFFSTKPRTQNTGLGLATVYGAIQQAGGFIRVDSTVGHGTTFTILFPEAQDTPDRPEKPALAQTPPRGSETILYAEDEEGVREFTSIMLEHLGYTVVSAASGNAALELAEKHPGPIDLLLTDTIMPGLNGRQTADKLGLTHPETLVLFTSGYSADVLSSTGVVDEGINFIPKPYSRMNLAKRIRAILDDKRG